MWVINARGRPQYLPSEEAKLLISKGTHIEFHGVPIRDYYPEFDNAKMGGLKQVKIAGSRDGDMLDVELIP